MLRSPVIFKDFVKETAELTCYAQFVKVGARLPRALWFQTHCPVHGPSVMVWGQEIWGTDGSPSVWYKGKALVWDLVPPVPSYL